MKTQLILLADDIKDNFKSMIINIIQLIAGLMVLCYIFQVSLDFKTVKQKINLAMKNTEIYMLRDNTSDKRLDKIINEDKYLPKLVKLYNEVKKLNSNAPDTNIYLANSSMNFYFSEDTELPKKLAETNTRFQGKMASQVSVTDNFFSIYHLKIDFGDDLKEEEKNISIENIKGTEKEYTKKENIEKEIAEKENAEKEDIKKESIKKEDTEKENIKNKDIKDIFTIKQKNPIPIILGADFRSVFNIHDIITDIKDREYEVVGFLEKHSYYVAPDMTKDLIDLGNYIIRPADIDLTDSVSICQYFDSLYLMTDNTEVAVSIAERSKELNLFDFMPINFSYQLEMIVEDTLDEIFVNSTFMIIILIFSFVGIIGNLLQFISNHKREFAINMLCGASVKQVIMRVLMQVVLMFLMGLIPALIIFGLLKAFKYTILCSIGFMLLVMIYPVYTVTKLTIQAMLKRSYE